MKNLRVFSFLTILFAMPQAFAQPQSSIAIQRSPAIVREVPTPDSVVWKSFYEGLQLRFHESTNEMQDFLMDTFGLTGSEAASVAIAGQQYLKQSAAIDAATKAEIATRFQPAGLPSNMAQIAQSAGLAAPSPSSPIGGRMADGRTVQEAIKADGLPVRYQRQHDAALQAHHVQLRQTIGPQKFTALQDWINSNVAPGIKSFDVTPPIPAPLTSPPVSPPTK